MKHLTDIELQQNSFTGTIPEDWFRATNLLHINIGGNDLSGSLPSSIAALTDLQRVFLYENNLSGSLPPQLFEMTSLSKSIKHLGRPSIVVQAVKGKVCWLASFSTISHYFACISRMALSEQ